MSPGASGVSWSDPKRWPVIIMDHRNVRTSAYTEQPTRDDTGITGGDEVSPSVSSRVQKKRRSRMWKGGGGCHWPHSCATAIVLTCIEVADPKLIAVVIAVFRYPWLNFVVAQIPEPPWPVRHHHDRNCNRTVVSKRKKEEYTKVLRLLATNAPTVGEETPMGCTPQLREEGQWGWQPHPWSSR